MDDFKTFLNDIRNLTPEEQSSLRREFFETHVARDAGFASLEKKDQDSIRNEILGVNSVLPKRNLSEQGSLKEPTFRDTLSEAALKIKDAATSGYQMGGPVGSVISMLLKGGPAAAGAIGRSVAGSLAERGAAAERELRQKAANVAESGYPAVRNRGRNLRVSPPKDEAADIVQAREAGQKIGEVLGDPLTYGPVAIKAARGVVGALRPSAKLASPLTDAASEIYNSGRILPARTATSIENLRQPIIDYQIKDQTLAGKIIKLRAKVEAGDATRAEAAELQQAIADRDTLVQSAARSGIPSAEGPSTAPRELEATSSATEDIPSERFAVRAMPGRLTHGNPVIDLSLYEGGDRKVIQVGDSYVPIIGTPTKLGQTAFNPTGELASAGELGNMPRSIRTRRSYARPEENKPYYLLNDTRLPFDTSPTEPIPSFANMPTAADIALSRSENPMLVDQAGRPMRSGGTEPASTEPASISGRSTISDVPSGALQTQIDKVLGGIGLTERQGVSATLDAAANTRISSNPFLDPEQWKAALSNPLARSTIGGVLGERTGDTPEEKIRNSVLGIIAGAAASPRAIRSLRGALADETGAVSSTGRALRAGRRMLREAEETTPAAVGEALTHEPSPILDDSISAVRRLRQRFTQTPQDVLGGTPAGKGIVDSAFEAQTRQNALVSFFQKQIADTYTGLNNTQIKRVNKLLDTEGGRVLASSLPTAEREAFDKADKLRAQWAEWGLVPEGERWSDYFPRVRDVFKAEGRKVIQVSDSYVPIQVQEDLTNRVKPFYLKDRTATAPADNLTLDPLNTYAKALARKVAMTGGYDPLAEKTVPGFVKQIEPHLAGLPEDVVDYAGRYANDILGVPRGDSWMSPKLAATIRRYMFDRTIGGNVLSPPINLTQQYLNLVASRPSSVWKGYRDVISWAGGNNPEFEQLLKEAGIRPSLNKADMGFLGEVGGAKLQDAFKRSPWRAIESLLARGFRSSEQLNQITALATGLNEANTLGLSGSEASKFAQDFVRLTQFNYGKAGLPEAWRSSGAGSLLTQYKQFPYHFTKFATQMAKSDLIATKNLVTKTGPAFLNTLASKDPEAIQTAFSNLMNTVPTKFFGKLMGGGTFLFGPDAMFLGLDKKLSEAATGDINKYSVEGLTHWKGVLPYFGMWVGNQLGMGAIPIEDFRNLMFFLPGPALSMFLDGLSVGMNLTVGQFGAGYTYDLNPFDQGPGAHEGTDWDAIVSKSARMLPAGIQLDRTRRALIQARSQAPDMVRRPATFAQAVGYEPLNQTNRPIKPAGSAESLRQFTGIQSPEVVKRMEALRRGKELDMSADQIMRAAAQIAVTTGKVEEGQKLLDAFSEAKNLPQHLVLTPESLKRSIRRGMLPPETEQILNTRKLLRPRVQDIQRQGRFGYEEE